MSNQIQVGMRKDFQSKDLWEMHRLRTRVFKDRMGWEVPILSGMEIDGYDAIDPYYMVIRGAGNVVCGCWRMLPTEGPYMLKDTFPELLHGVEPPEANNVWELSRFAIETEGPQGFGFAGLALDAKLALASRHRSVYEERKEVRFNPITPLHAQLVSLLPSRLTAAQERVIREIFRDMISPRPMYRLVQGDVGSGKTAVALQAIVIALWVRLSSCLVGSDRNPYGTALPPPIRNVAGLGAAGGLSSRW